jgi:outer membrane protein assembly factor BamB
VESVLRSVFFRLTASAVFAASGCSEVPSASPWPKFRRDAVQDGVSSVIPTQSGGAAWTFPTGRGVFSSPVIGADGTVYVGSADRTFYALNPTDGSVRWKLLTGQIIDSAALVDESGHVYFGSGDGLLRGVDGATGRLLWAMAADPPSLTTAFINWFEGNVGLTAAGQLLVPNDNWIIYTVDPSTGTVIRRTALPDQVWSLPAVDVTTGDFYVGNNNVVDLLGGNLYAYDSSDAHLWNAFSPGSIAASPMLAPDGSLIVGGFDGYVRAYDPGSGMVKWAFAARDHIYASPAHLSDGTVIQASADGSLYALNPASGAEIWEFDTQAPIRSSPAVDGDDNIYFGSGDGRMYVVNRDGTLRWSIQLITADRDDVNASPALGNDAVYIAGASGEIFSVPYEYCLRPDGQADARCAPPVALDLPADGGVLLYTTDFGSQ